MALDSFGDTFDSDLSQPETPEFQPTTEAPASSKYFEEALRLASEPKAQPKSQLGDSFESAYSDMLELTKPTPKAFDEGWRGDVNLREDVGGIRSTISQGVRGATSLVTDPVRFIAGVSKSLTGYGDTLGKIAGSADSMVNTMFPMNPESSQSFVGEVAGGIGTTVGLIALVAASRGLAGRALLAEERAAVAAAEGNAAKTAEYQAAKDSLVAKELQLTKVAQDVGHYWMGGQLGYGAFEKSIAQGDDPLTATAKGLAYAYAGGKIAKTVNEALFDRLKIFFGPEAAKSIVANAGEEGIKKAIEQSGLAAVLKSTGKQALLGAGAMALMHTAETGIVKGELPNAGETLRSALVGGTVQGLAALPAAMYTSSVAKRYTQAEEARLQQIRDAKAELEQVAPETARAFEEGMSVRNKVADEDAERIVSEAQTETEPQPEWIGGPQPYAKTKTRFNFPEVKTEEEVARITPESELPSALLATEEKAQQVEKFGVTSEAVDLLTPVEVEGKISMPSVSDRQLVKIAKENDIEINESTTRKDIYETLLEKKQAKDQEFIDSNGITREAFDLLQNRNKRPASETPSALLPEGTPEWWAKAVREREAADRIEAPKVTEPEVLTPELIKAARDNGIEVSQSTKVYDIYARLLKKMEAHKLEQSIPKVEKYSGINDEAAKLLATLDLPESTLPTFSKKIADIAKENDIEVTAKSTTKAIVDQLRAKAAATVENFKGTFRENKITEEARVFIEKLESSKAETPTFFTNQLVRMANDNGIKITGETSVADVVDALREKYAPALNRKLDRAAVESLAEQRAKALLEANLNKLKAIPKSPSREILDQIREREIKLRELKKTETPEAIAESLKLSEEIKQLNSDLLELPVEEGGAKSYAEVLKEREQELLKGIEGEQNADAKVALQQELADVRNKIVEEGKYQAEVELDLEAPEPEDTQVPWNKLTEVQRNIKRKQFIDKSIENGIPVDMADVTRELRGNPSDFTGLLNEIGQAYALKFPGRSITADQKVENINASTVGTVLRLVQKGEVINKSKLVGGVWKLVPKQVTKDKWMPRSGQLPFVRTTLPKLDDQGILQLQIKGEALQKRQEKIQGEVQEVTNQIAGDRVGKSIAEEELLADRTLLSRAEQITNRENANFEKAVKENRAYTPSYTAEETALIQEAREKQKDLAVTRTLQETTLGVERTRAAIGRLEAEQAALMEVNVKGIMYEGLAIKLGQRKALEAKIAGLEEHLQEYSGLVKAYNRRTMSKVTRVMVAPEMRALKAARELLKGMPSEQELTSTGAYDFVAEWTRKDMSGESPLITREVISRFTPLEKYLYTEVVKTTGNYEAVESRKATLSKRIAETGALIEQDVNASKAALVAKVEEAMSKYLGSRDSAQSIIERIQKSLEPKLTKEQKATVAKLKSEVAELEAKAEALVVTTPIAGTNRVNRTVSDSVKLEQINSNINKKLVSISKLEVSLKPTKTQAAELTKAQKEIALATEQINSLTRAKQAYEDTAVREIAAAKESQLAFDMAELSVLSRPRYAERMSTLNADLKRNRSDLTDLESNLQTARKNREEALSRRAGAGIADKLNSVFEELSAAKESTRKATESGDTAAISKAEAIEAKLQESYDRVEAQYFLRSGAFNRVAYFDSKIAEGYTRLQEVLDRKESFKRELDTAEIAYAIAIDPNSNRIVSEPYFDNNVITMAEFLDRGERVVIPKEIVNGGTLHPRIIPRFDEALGEFVVDGVDHPKYGFITAEKTVDRISKYREQYNLDPKVILNRLEEQAKERSKVQEIGEKFAASVAGEALKKAAKDNPALSDYIEVVMKAEQARQEKLERKLNNRRSTNKLSEEELQQKIKVSSYSKLSQAAFEMIFARFPKELDSISKAYKENINQLEGDLTAEFFMTNSTAKRKGEWYRLFNKSGQAEVIVKEQELIAVDPNTKARSIKDNQLTKALAFTDRGIAASITSERKSKETKQAAGLEGIKRTRGEILNIQDTQKQYQQLLMRLKDKALADKPKQQRSEIIDFVKAQRKELLSSIKSKTPIEEILATLKKKNDLDVEALKTLDNQLKGFDVEVRESVGQEDIYSTDVNTGRVGIPLDSLLARNPDNDVAFLQAYNPEKATSKQKKRYDEIIRRAGDIKEKLALLALKKVWEIEANNENSIMPGVRDQGVLIAATNDLLQRLRVEREDGSAFYSGATSEANLRSILKYAARDRAQKIKGQRVTLEQFEQVKTTEEGGALTQEATPYMEQQGGGDASIPKDQQMAIGEGRTPQQVLKNIVLQKVQASQTPAEKLFLGMVQQGLPLKAGEQKKLDALVRKNADTYKRYTADVSDIIRNDSELRLALREALAETGTKAEDIPKVLNTLTAEDMGELLALKGYSLKGSQLMGKLVSAVDQAAVRAKARELNSKVKFKFSEEISDIQAEYDSASDSITFYVKNVENDQAAIRLTYHELTERNLFMLRSSAEGRKELVSILNASKSELMKALPDLLKQGGFKDVSEFREAYKFDNTPMGEQRMLGELMARFAERLADQPRPTWWQGIMAKVRIWMSKYLGVNLNTKAMEYWLAGNIEKFAEVSGPKVGEVPEILYSKKGKSEYEKNPISIVSDGAELWETSVKLQRNMGDRLVSEVLQLQDRLRQTTKVKVVDSLSGKTTEPAMYDPASKTIYIAKDAATKLDDLGASLAKQGSLAAMSEAVSGRLVSEGESINPQIPDIAKDMERIAKVVQKVDPSVTSASKLAEKLTDADFVDRLTKIVDTDNRQSVWRSVNDNFYALMGIDKTKSLAESFAGVMFNNAELKYIKQQRQKAMAAQNTSVVSEALKSLIDGMPEVKKIVGEMPKNIKADKVTLENVRMHFSAFNTLEEQALSLDTQTKMSRDEVELARGIVGIRMNLMGEALKQKGYLKQAERYFDLAAIQLDKSRAIASEEGRVFRMFGVLKDIFNSEYIKRKVVDPIVKRQSTLSADKFVQELEKAILNAKIVAGERIASGIPKWLERIQKSKTPEQTEFSEIFSDIMASGKLDDAIMARIAEKFTKLTTRRIEGGVTKSNLQILESQVYAEVSKQLRSLITERAKRSPAEVADILLDNVDLIRGSFEKAKEVLLASGKLTPEQVSAISKAKFRGYDLSAASDILRRNIKISKIVREHMIERDSTVTALIDKLVTEGNLPEKDAEAVGQALRDAFNIESKKEIARQLESLKKQKDLINGKVRNLNIEDIFKFANLGVFSEKELYNSIAKANPHLRMPTWESGAVDQLQKQADRIQRMPEGDLRQQEIVKVLGSIADYHVKNMTKGQKAWYFLGDVMPAIWQAGVLSGVPTHMVNLFNTGLNVVLRSGFQAYGMQRKAMNEGRGFVETLGFYKDIIDSALNTLNVFDSLSGGRVIVKQALTTGSTRFRNLQARELSILERGWVSSLPHKWVGRFMAAADGLNCEVASEINQRHAMRYAELTQGKDASKVAAMMEQAFNPDTNVLTDIRAQVDREASQGLLGDLKNVELNKRIRFNELKAARRAELAGNENYIGESIEASLKWTFNDAPKGLLAIAMAAPAEMLNSNLKISRYFLSFMNTTTNLVNSAIDFSPVGWARAYNYRFSAVLPEGNRFKAAKIEHGSAEFYALRAQGIAGTVLFTALGTIIANSLEKEMRGEKPFLAIYGEGPKDPYKQMQKQQGSQWRPNCIRIGDDVLIRYTDLPALGPLMGMLGSIGDMIRDHKDDKKDFTELAPVAMTAMASHLFQRDLMQGLSSFLVMLQNPDERGVRAWKKQASGVVGGFTNPQIAKWIRGVYEGAVSEDGNIIKVEQSSTKGWLASMIPFSGGYDVPSLNVLGQPIKQSWMEPAFQRRFGYLKMDIDPILGKLAEADVSIPSPQKTVQVWTADGKRGVGEGDEVWRDYVKLRGEHLTRILTPDALTQIKTIRDTSGSEMAQRLMKKISDTASDIAVKQLMMRIHNKEVSF